MSSWTVTSSAPTGDEREAELAALIADIAERSAEFRRQKQVSRDIVERVRSIGVYRMLVAAELKGEARSPGEFCQLIERIPVADGSVAGSRASGSRPPTWPHFPLRRCGASMPTAPT